MTHIRVVAQAPRAAAAGRDTGMAPAAAVPADFLLGEVGGARAPRPTPYVAPRLSLPVTNHSLSNCAVSLLVHPRERGRGRRHAPRYSAHVPSAFSVLEPT
jgi:hypothetical protein